MKTIPWGMAIFILDTLWVKVLKWLNFYIGVAGFSIKKKKRNSALYKLKKSPWTWFIIEEVVR